MAAAHFQHGRTLEALGRVPDAVPPLRSAVAAAQSAGGRDSDYPVALALALASIARHTEALEAFDSALSISALPDASGGMGPEGIWLNRGNSLHALGQGRARAFQCEKLDEYSGRRFIFLQRDDRDRPQDVRGQPSRCRYPSEDHVDEF